MIRYDLNNMIEFIYHNQRLEGSPTTLEDTADLLLRVNSSDIASTKYVTPEIDSNSAMVFVGQVYQHHKILNDFFQNYHLNKELLKLWHDQLFADQTWIYDLNERVKNIGLYRDTHVYTIRKNGDKHFFYEPDKVEESMEYLFTQILNLINMDYDMREQALVIYLRAVGKEYSIYTNSEYIEAMLYVLGQIHWKFEEIHPFSDGNGRLGRLLINHIWFTILPELQKIYKHKLNPGFLIIDSNDREQYLDALGKTHIEFGKWFYEYFLPKVAPWKSL